MRWFWNIHLQNGDHLSRLNALRLDRTNVMLMKFPSLAALDAVVLKTSNAVSDETFIKMMHSSDVNHRRIDCLLNRLFRRGWKKTPWSSASLAFVMEIHRWFPSRRVSYAENVSIWWRHQGHSRFNVYTYGVHPPTRRICSSSPGSHARRSSLCFIALVLSVSTTPGHNTPIRTPVLSLPIKRCRKQHKRNRL